MKIVIGMLLSISPFLFAMNQELTPDAIRAATIGVTIYRDESFDKTAWHSIIKEIEAFDKGEFSIAALKKTIDFMYEKSLNSKGVWGGAPITYLKDAEKADGPKKSK